MSPESSVPIAPSSVPPADGGTQSPLVAAALAQLSEGVIVSDAAGRIVFVNAVAARLHGIPRLDAPPAHGADTIRLLDEHGGSLPTAELPPLRAALGADTARDARWRIRRADGSELPVLGRARPLLAPDGRPMSLVLALRDDGAYEADTPHAGQSAGRRAGAGDQPRSGAIWRAAWTVISPSRARREWAAPSPRPCRSHDVSGVRLCDAARRAYVRALLPVVPLAPSVCPS